MTVLQGPWGRSGDDEAPELVESPPGARDAGAPARAAPQLDQLWGRLDHAMRYARTATSRLASCAAPTTDATIKELLSGYETIQHNVAELAKRLEAAAGGQGPGPNLLDIEQDLLAVERQVQGYVGAAEECIAKAGGPPPPAQRSGILAQADAGASTGFRFNPLWLALAAGVALTGVAIWQARKTDKELKRAPAAPRRRAKR